MDTNDLTKHIQVISEHFKATRPGQTAYERMLSRTVKLTEEVGEVSEAVLYENNEQRNTKTDVDLDGELADVLICTLLLAADREHDIWETAKTKLESFRKKYNI